MNYGTENGAQRFHRNNSYELLVVTDTTHTFTPDYCSLFP